MKKTKKLAVVLSGCGYKDGSEITEAVSLIVNLSQLGAAITFFAPENRMTESARITRDQISDVKNLKADDFDALAFPGGFGAALHLCNWAEKGSKCEVNPSVAKAIRDFHSQSKPIGAICIAPVLLARVLGAEGVEVTIGNDSETAAEIEKTGARHVDCPVDDYVTDRTCKVITTPAYMYGKAHPHEVFNGISGLAKELMEMA